ncbi:hypothetical protein QDG88_03775 [Pseudoalteromonas piscicida]|uniref:hypothetical protein n=1 Tax=Pseudoalteromonas piscicida TaxID=43662 RepID=UPI00273A3FD8|nr:hypothetical protein [Pseudoalteromonas piscicida]MDP4487070.1 hypothetical protein [Pseudoalteromonas piscicida]
MRSHHDEQTEISRGVDFIASGNYKLRESTLTLTLKVGATDNSKLEKFSFVASDDPNYTFMGEWYINNKTKVYAQYYGKDYYYAFSCDLRLSQ